MSTSVLRKKSIDQIQADVAAGMSEHAQEEVGGEAADCGAHSNSAISL